MQNKKGFKIAAISVSAILLVLAIGLTVFNWLPWTVGIKQSWILPVESTMDDKDKLKLEASGEALAEMIESEGIVLTKNANDTLPLSYSATKAKGGINVFGWSSTSWVPGGSGSGRVTRSNGNYYAETGIVNALTKAGIDYNEELYKFYIDRKSVV